MTEQKADRYTALTAPNDELSEYIAAANKLNTHWFIVKSPVSKNSSEMYVFFDSAGLKNFLSGKYDNVDDGELGNE